jgi:hypothetical protein
MIKDDLECRLQIGDMTCSLRLENPDYSGFLRKYYHGFLTEKDPDLTIHLRIIPHQEEISLPNSIIMSKKVEGNNFNFHSGLIVGKLDLDIRQCTVEVKECLFNRIRIFEHFLFQTYYTLVEHQGDSNENFLVHSCAISKNGAGYLFTGPPESGKSTIAKLSSDYTVLGDEMTIIKKMNRSYRINATPFRGDFRESVNGNAPLKAIFLIKHDKKNFIKKISKREFVTRFLREVVYPGTLLSTDRRKEFSKMMDFCNDISENVPFFELNFLPDKSFWNLIEDNNLKKNVVINAH